MEEQKPGYYAIIPASVRYDDQIPANAKLLYGEISALIGAEGFCFAQNQYFADIYGFSTETVARLVSKLEKAGYIKRKLERDKSGQVVRRKLYLSVSLPEIHPLDNFDTTSPQKNQEGIDEKVKDTNLSNTSNNTPHSPPQGGGVPKKSKRDYKSAADVLPERFEGFWLFYRTNMPQGSNAGNRQKTIRAWDKLAPDDNLATAMAVALKKQVKSQAWQSGVGVPHASTWLNNRGWEDDWGPAALAPESHNAQEQGRNEEWL